MVPKYLYIWYDKYIIEVVKEKLVLPFYNFASRDKIIEKRYNYYYI